MKFVISGGRWYGSVSRFQFLLRIICDRHLLKSSFSRGPCTNSLSVYFAMILLSSQIFMCLLVTTFHAKPLENSMWAFQIYESLVLYVRGVLYPRLRYFSLGTSA